MVYEEVSEWEILTAESETRLALYSCALKRIQQQDFQG
jgi:hypothetical protein